MKKAVGKLASGHKVFFFALSGRKRRKWLGIEGDYEVQMRFCKRHLFLGENVLS
jgi:hypothetical protein